MEASPSRGTVGPLLITLLAALTALDAVAIDMFLPALPALQQDLATTPAAAQQTLATFLAGLAVGQLFCGPLLDHFGRRPPLLAGLLLYTLANISAAWCDNIGALLIARFAQALGASAAVAAPRALVSDHFAEPQAARVYTLLMQVFMLGPVIAPLAGTALTAAGSWRTVFWALSLGGAALWAWSLLGLPETLPPNRRHPLNLGFALRTYARLLTGRSYALTVLAGSISGGSLIAYLGQAPFVMQNHFGLTPAAFSTQLTINALGIIVAGHLNSRLLRGRAPHRIVIGALSVHTLLGLALGILVAAGAAPAGLYALGLFLTMATFGLTFGNLTAMSMVNAGNQAGAASALAGVIQTVLAALISVVVSVLPPGPAPLPLICFACGGIGLLCALFAMPRRFVAL